MRVAEILQIVFSFSSLVFAIIAFCVSLKNARRLRKIGKEINDELMK